MSSSTNYQQGVSPSANPVGRSAALSSPIREGLLPTYEVDRLLHRIQDGIRCPINSSHGSYEYVCTNSDSICDKLVCVDCLRADPLHFNAHSKQFIRIRDFLESITTVVHKHDKQKQLDEIRYFEKRTRGLIDSFDRQSEKVLATIQSFFLNLQERYINVVKKKISAATKRISQDFLADISTDRQNLAKILENCANFTKFSNKSHILELFMLLEKGTNNSSLELRKRFTKLNKLMSNFDRNVEDWLSRCRQIDTLDDKEFVPQVNLTVMNPHLSNHEQLCSNMLNSLLPESSESIFTVASRRLLPAVLSFLPQGDTSMQQNLSCSHHKPSWQQQTSKGLLHPSSEHPSLIYDPVIPSSSLDTKHSRLQEIDRRIQELFEEGVYQLSRQHVEDRERLADVGRDVEGLPDDSRLEQVIGMYDLLGSGGDGDATSGDRRTGKSKISLDRSNQSIGPDKARGVVTNTGPRDKSRVFL
jgi:hypothetical protein